MAPRVHNSGHWTIEGALTSQFENHIRAICGLPLGATDRVVPRVEMRNLIGDEAERWREILADPAAHLHLYGKGEPRPGRKMGHVTRLIGLSRRRSHAGRRRLARLHHLDRQAEPLELRPDPGRVADHHPDELVGIDVARARLVSSVCAVMPR